MVLIHAPRLPPAPGSECIAHHFHGPTSGWLQIQFIGKKQIYKIEMTKGSSTCINFNINKISMRTQIIILLFSLLHRVNFLRQDFAAAV